MSRRDPHREPPPVGDPAEDELGPRRPREALRSLTVAVIGLILVAALLCLYAVRTEGRAIDAEQQAADVEDRLERLEGVLDDRARLRDEERDSAAAQANEDRERFRANLCEVLGELSATAPNLERLRDALGCQQQGAAPAALGDDPATRPPPGRPPPRSDQPAPSGGSTPTAPTEPTAPGRGPIGDLLCSFPLLC